MTAWTAYIIFAIVLLSILVGIWFFRRTVENAEEIVDEPGPMGSTGESSESRLANSSRGDAEEASPAKSPESTE